MNTSSKLESSALHSQDRERKREACGSHLSSIRERYGTILGKVGCLCKELIARNLEPYYTAGKPASLRSTKHTAKQRPAPSILGEDVDGTICIKEKCDIDGNHSDALKKGDCRGSEKPVGISLVMKDSCCDAGEKGSCCGTKDKCGNPCTDQAEYCDGEKEFSPTNTNNDNCGTTEIETNYPVAETAHYVGFEDRNGSCSTGKEACTGVEVGEIAVWLERKPSVLASRQINVAA